MNQLGVIWVLASLLIACGNPKWYEPCEDANDCYFGMGGQCVRTPQGLTCTKNCDVSSATTQPYNLGTCIYSRADECPGVGPIYNDDGQTGCCLITVDDGSGQGSSGWCMPSPP